MSVNELRQLLLYPNKNAQDIKNLIKKKQKENLKWLNKINLNNKDSKYLQLALMYLRKTGKIQKHYILKHSGFAEIDFGELMVALYKIAQFFSKSKRGKYARRYRKI